MSINKKLNLKAFLIICPIILSLTACSQSSEETEKTTAADVTIQMTSDGLFKLNGSTKAITDTNTKTNKPEKVNENTKTPVAEPWQFGKSDLYVNKKPVLSATYEQLIKDFGKSYKMDEFKVNPPATEPDYYYYFKVLDYNGLVCEFNIDDKDRELKSEDTITRFDITNSSFKLDCGLKIGMTVSDIIKQFGERSVYKLDSNEDNYELNAIKHVLKSYKPQGKYSDYSQAMIIYCDPEKFENGLARALVLLINNDRLDRIVFGYPTAD